MRIYLLAMFCVNAQVYSARVLILDSKEQVIDTQIYDENIILADSMNKNGNNLGDLMEIINEGVLMEDFNKLTENELKNIPINNEIGGVLESYLKPLSKLSELFPNQQVEVQLEIDGSNYVPKRYLRQSETSVLPSSSSASTTTPSTTTPTKSQSPTNAAVNDRPVYMSDLKKVFEEFEKTHTKFHDNVNQAPFVNIKQTVGNLNDLMGLLKKGSNASNTGSGVRVEKGIGQPTGENMSWFQIKIPRN